MAMKMGGYNITRDDSALLEEHEHRPPSFTVHLYPDHWTMNNGPKFSYTNPVSSLLDDIRAFRIPADFIQIFDDAGVPYYNGCLIVELLDFRPAKAREPILERPDKQRVVLRPNGETIWTDICMMNVKAGSKWSDADALQVESKLLLATSPPLCLEPDPSLTRIVNSILRVSTPNIPNSLRRKATAMVDPEEDETEKAKRAKIMQFMNPQYSPSRKPYFSNYKILAALERRRAAQSQQQAPQLASIAAAPANTPSGTLAPPSINSQQAPEKTLSTVAPHLTTAYSQSTSISQPAPMAMAQMQASQQTQSPVDSSQRTSPSKQQQPANGAAPPLRPPSRPLTAQANASNQQSQAQGQQTMQPVQFNPSVPSSDFLNPTVPVNKRRASAATKPSTPAVSSTPLPSQQPPSNQSQQQQSTQAQAQAQAQTQPHMPGPAQPQQQVAQAQSQQIPPQVQQQGRAMQIPPNMASFQAMAQLRNLTQYRPNAGGMPQTAQAAQAMAAAVAAHRHNMAGRQTPINRVNSSASPAPSNSTMTQSPILPQAAAAMMSRQNTPVANNPQAQRGSPLVGNPANAARAGAVQSGPQQQPQQQMTGSHPVMMPSGTTMNPALRYSLYMQAQAQRAAQLQQQQQQQHGQVGQANSQQQPNQQSGAAQLQQANQEQATAAQQPFPVQVPPQAYNYMQMNMAQNPQYMWQQRAAMGRGMPPIAPNGQQQIPAMPPGMTLQQMQGLGRGGNLQQNR